MGTERSGSSRIIWPRCWVVGHFDFNKAEGADGLPASAPSFALPCRGLPLTRGTSPHEFGANRQLSGLTPSGPASPALDVYNLAPPHTRVYSFLSDSMRAKTSSICQGRFVSPAAIAGVVLRPPRAFVRVP